MLAPDAHQISAKPFDYERTVALSTAYLRCLISTGAAALVYLDRSTPHEPGGGKLTLAYALTGLYLAYALGLLFLLRTDRLNSAAYQLLGPIADFAFATVIVIATDGYLSPLQLLFAFAIIGGGVWRAVALPIAIGTAAAAALVLIALVPQHEALDVPRFAARTGFILLFAAVVTLLNRQLIGQATAISALEELGRDLATSHTLEEARESLEGRLRQVLPGAEVEADFKPLAERQEGPEARIWHVASGSNVEVWCRITRVKGLTRIEERYVGLALRWLLSASRRISLTQDLLEAAAREERLRVADEVHDSYLQTLAALDLHLEAARRDVADPELVLTILEEAKQIARNGAERSRAFVSEQLESRVVGPENLSTLLESRYGDRIRVSIDTEVKLTEAQWRAAELLAREGSNNARAHAGVEQVEFSIRPDNGMLVAEVRDNQGVLAQPVRFGYGLERVRRMVEACGGELTLSNRPEGGVELKAAWRITDV